MPCCATAAQDGSARTREAKLGCVFTQRVRDGEGKPLRDPGSTSYTDTGTYQGCREVAVLLQAKSRRWTSDPIILPN